MIQEPESAFAMNWAISFLEKIKIKDERKFGKDFNKLKVKWKMRWREGKFDSRYLTK